MFETRKAAYESVPNVKEGTTSNSNNNTDTAVLAWRNRQMPGAAAGASSSSVGAEAAAKQCMQQAREQYSDLNLNDNQARLLGLLYQSIQNGNRLDLDLPGSMALVLSMGDDNDSAMNAKNLSVVWAAYDEIKMLLIQLLQPTVTAIITLAVAFYLEAQGRLLEANRDIRENVEVATTQPAFEFWTIWMIRIFPYVNATLVFCATVTPLQHRVMTRMVDPLFTTFDRTEDYLQATMQEVGPLVDATIDQIQKEFHVMMEPIQPKLDALQGQADLAEKIIDKFEKTDQNIDIPDPSDIDRELDEAQGLVGERIDQAKTHLGHVYKAHVPSMFHSPSHFYWQIVFPVIILAWILQMALAYGNTRQESRPPVLEQSFMDHDTSFVVYPKYHLRGSSKILDPTLLAVDNKDQYNHAESPATFPDDKLPSLMRNETQQGNTTMTSEVDNMRQQYHEYQNQANETFHSMFQNVSNQLHEYQEDLRTEYNDNKDIVIAQSRALVHNVLWSYVLAILQLCLVSIITSKAVQSWVVRHVMKRVQKGAEQTLDKFGVFNALEQVFGVYLPNVQEKVLRLMRVYKKMEGVLLGVSGSLCADSAATLASFVLPPGGTQQVENVVEKAKKNKLLGLLFKD